MAAAKAAAKKEEPKQREAVAPQAGGDAGDPFEKVHREMPPALSTFPAHLAAPLIGCGPPAHCVPFPQTEMEMPPSWVAKLAMDRERFQSRCPSGARLTIFRKARSGATDRATRPPDVHQDAVHTTTATTAPLRMNPAVPSKSSLPPTVVNRHEMYSAYAREDGLVERLVIFADVGES